jgi:uncharacterized damage-inducible protein DinB
LTVDALMDSYRFLAHYNTGFNARLYDACEQLDDAARKAPRGAFFGSIHATLNHLLWGDMMWLGRFAAQGEAPDVLPADLLVLPAGARHETELHADWAALRAHRARLDAAIEAWLAALPADFPQRSMRYINTKGVQRVHPMWQALTHFFNHQTHHRGQVSTLLMQAGVDVGVTDLIAWVQ